MGQQETPGGTEEAKAATGAVNSPWPGRRSIGPPYLHLRRHHGWEIETYFKLLKSAGQQLEQWKQRTGAAVARRLLVASMACALAWRAASLPGPEGEQLRDVLVRLSGRLVKPAAGFTLPALLAGLEVLLVTVVAVEHYGVPTLRQCAEAAGLITSPATQINPNDQPDHQQHLHEDTG